MADDDEETRATAATEGEDEADIAAMLDLSKKKKKKKKKTGADDGGKSAASSKAATTGTTTSAGSGLSGADLADQQRRVLELDAAQDAAFADGNGEGEEDRKAGYTYDELLDRVVDLLHTHHPDLVEKKRTRIKPPQLQLMSSKKTLWVNFQEICSMMQRDPTHVYAFFMAELGTEGSIDGNQRLIIRGKYVAKYIESLLRKYVVEYVTCEMCRSPHTNLKKDPSSRLYFCECQDCGSSRSVAPIRTGYHATSRADRRAARAAKG